jgi:hypothetical protein
MTEGKIKYRAMLSGFFAGSASCIAKFALDPASPIPNWAHEKCLTIHATTVDEGGDGYGYGDGDGSNIDYTCLVVSLIPRGIFLLVMIGVNLLMVASFMQGMSESGTVIATALSTGTNFSVSVSINYFLLCIAYAHLLYFKFDCMFYSSTHQTLCDSYLLLLDIGCIWCIVIQRET